MKFYKLQASGNDFILIDCLTSKKGYSANFYKNFAGKYCERKLGVGADGVLVIEPSKTAAFKMRIFNSDGSEAEMCGNGARCAAHWANLKLHSKGKKKKVIHFETKAGIIEPEAVGKEEVRIKMTEPFGLMMDISVDVFSRKTKANFINTGVPHAVIFVEGLDHIDVKDIGREIRFHERFSPAGANVNFVEFKGGRLIRIRTYERGVETETLACGTGSVAAAIIAWLKIHNPDLKTKKSAALNVKTRSGETLKICFDINKGAITNVWLQGKVYLVYEGNIDL